MGLAHQLTSHGFWRASLPGNPLACPQGQASPRTFFLFFFKADALFIPRHFWTKPQTPACFATFLSAVWCAGLKRISVQFSQPRVARRFPFCCRLPAGNWKMGHRKPSLLHLSHFVITAPVSFCLVCQLRVNPQRGAQFCCLGPR